MNKTLIAIISSIAFCAVTPTFADNNIVDDTVNATEKAVHDTAKGTENVVNDAARGTGNAIKGTGKAIDKTFKK